MKSNSPLWCLWFGFFYFSGSKHVSPACDGILSSQAKSQNRTTTKKNQLITILIVNSNKKKRKRDIKKIHCIWRFSKSCTVLKQPTFKYHDQAAVLFLILELQPGNQHFILPNCTTGIIFNNKYTKHSWLLFTWNFFFWLPKKKSLQVDLAM